MALQVHPELCAVAEIQTQAECGVSRYAAPIVDDFGDAIGRDPDRLRDLVLRQVIRGQELLFQHFAGVTGANSFVAIVVSCQ
jgi:hypothetical protein